MALQYGVYQHLLDHWVRGAIADIDKEVASKEELQSPTFLQPCLSTLLPHHHLFVLCKTTLPTKPPPRISASRKQPTWC